MIEAETPTLWDIRMKLGHAAAIAILVHAFIHAAKLVNLDKNLTQEQIGEAANDVLEQYGYLKVEEIKYLLKRALRSEKVYGRLDYNVLMNWVEQYDAERTEEAMRVSEQEDAKRLAENPDTDGTVSMADYMKSLEQRAAHGDKEAADKLATLRALAAQPAVPTQEERAAKDNAFYKFKIDYRLKRHGNRQSDRNSTDSENR